MNEETRRMQILEAEEAIKQMVDQVSRAKRAADGAEAVNGKLDEAMTVLRDALTSVHGATKQFEATASQYTRQSNELQSQTTEALRQATTALTAAQGKLLDAGKAIADLRADSIRANEVQSKRLTEYLDRLEHFAAEHDRQFARLRRLNKLILVVAVLGVIAAAAALIMPLISKAGA